MKLRTLKWTCAEWNSEEANLSSRVLRSNNKLERERVFFSTARQKLDRVVLNFQAREPAFIKFWCKGRWHRRNG